MSEFICPRCKRTVAANEEVCHHCGCDLLKCIRKRSAAFRNAVITFAILFFLIFALLFGFAVKFGFLQLQKEEKAIEMPPVELEDPVEEIKLSADSLVALYTANELQAEATVGRKIVVVEGTVSRVKKDLLDRPYVSLKSQSGKVEVQCLLLPESVEKSMTFAKGDAITVYGKCDGKYGNVLIRDCNIK